MNSSGVLAANRLPSNSARNGSFVWRAVFYTLSGTTYGSR